MLYFKHFCLQMDKIQKQSRCFTCTAANLDTINYSLRLNPTSNQTPLFFLMKFFSFFFKEFWDCCYDLRGKTFRKICCSFSNQNNNFLLIGIKQGDRWNSFALRIKTCFVGKGSENVVDFFFLHVILKQTSRWHCGSITNNITAAVSNK